MGRLFMYLPMDYQLDLSRASTHNDTLIAFVNKCYPKEPSQPKYHCVGKADLCGYGMFILLSDSTATPT